MTVKELIIRLHRLNPDIEICFDAGANTVTDMTVENITESCDDDTVIGYIICERREPVQLELFPEYFFPDVDRKEMN